MRRIAAVLALGTLVLSGCSKGHRDESADSYGDSGSSRQKVTTVDIKEAAPEAAVAPAEGGAMAPPGINVTAAPGVAFDYRYAFVLPDTAISAVQEQHAQACEKLGVQRCRITGMHYTLVSEDEVRGQLQFKLDPTLARNFGKDGIAAVERAKGRLVDAAIEGTDAGAAIEQSQRRSAQNAAELDRIDKQLAGSGLGDAERTQLRQQAERLRGQQSGEQATRDQGEEMLANTPMTFNYTGKSGFSWDNDALSDAWDTSKSSFTTMVSVILVLIGALLPWALLIALVVLLWRKTPLRHLRLRRRKALPLAPLATSPGPVSPASPPVP